MICIRLHFRQTHHMTVIMRSQKPLHIIQPNIPPDSQTSDEFVLRVFALNIAAAKAACIFSVFLMFKQNV